MSEAVFAMGDSFLDAFSNVDRAQQKKVREFVEKCRAFPDRPGMNYERLVHTDESHLYSARIDQAYRAIVFHPKNQNVYMLVWVDKHDAAYRWAERRRLSINAVTGAIQILPIEIAKPVAIRPEKKEREGLFTGLRDRELISLGVPDALLPKVRAIENERELEEASREYPAEVSEALFGLASGMTVDEVYRELNRPIEPVKIDVEDYITALQNLDSRRRFVVVEDARELAQVLNWPLDRWRVFLHPSQQRTVTMIAKGPVRVLGGAGTGKTVTAMHRAKFLAEQVFKNESDRILFTTYTKNLAADIQENLKKICDAAVLKRIEVVHLDKWVSDFLKKNGYRVKPAYDDDTASYWEQAISLCPNDVDLPEAFFKEEWERVIQPAGIISEQEYMLAPRLGRGRRIIRRDRKKIWTVFEEYRSLLERDALREPMDLMRDARIVLEKGGGQVSYRAVIVDEAQDMNPEAYRLIRQIVPSGNNDLFVVGDAHQRIYRHKAVLGRCGIDIRGRGRKLKINYRTTDEIRKYATALLGETTIDDLDGGQDDQKGYMSLIHGAPPYVENFKDFKKEVSFIKGYLQDLVKKDIPLADVCLITRTKKLLGHYSILLGEAGIEIYQVLRAAADDRSKPGLRLATMHRVKGLEFDRVIVASANADVLPLKASVIDSEDPLEVIENENRERALLYVAVTRARREAVICSWGEPSAFLTNIEK